MQSIDKLIDVCVSRLAESDGTYAVDSAFRETSFEEIPTSVGMTGPEEIPTLVPTPEEISPLVPSPEEIPTSVVMTSQERLRFGQNEGCDGERDSVVEDARRALRMRGFPCHHRC